jgi:hypothetical protein
VLEHRPPHPEIVPIAKALGVEAQGPSLVLRRGPFTIRISLDFNSGTVVGLDYHLQTHPLPEMRLRPETPLDGTGKAHGINVEVQTGDAEFDERVYIESNAPEHAVRAALAEAAVRAAVLEAICIDEEVLFGADGIRLSSRSLIPAYVERSVARLVSMAAALPRFAEGDRGRPLRTIAPEMLVLFLGGNVAAAAIYVGHRMYPPVSNLPAVLAGLGAGAALFLVVAPLAYLRLRGRSTSLRHIGLTVVVAALLGLPLGSRASTG